MYFQIYVSQTPKIYDTISLEASVENVIFERVNEILNYIKLFSFQLHLFIIFLPGNSYSYHNKSKLSKENKILWSISFREVIFRACGRRALPLRHIKYDRRTMRKIFQNENPLEK